MSNFSATQAIFPSAPVMKPMISALSVRRFFGLVFSFAVIGLWLAPGASITADVLLLKTGLTGILTFCAIASLVHRD